VAETKKRKKKVLTIAQQIRKAQIATSNALKHKKIADTLAMFMYTKAKLEAGLKLANDVEALDTKQKALKGQQISITKTLTGTLKKAKKSYLVTLEIARVAFRGKAGPRTALMLGGKRKESTAGQLDQATKLYQNTINNDKYLSTMKNFGYNKPKLQAEFKLFKEAAKLDNAQEHAKAASQRATAKRDEKLKKMKRWISDFKRIAKAALKDDRQALEALGIVAKRK
jgi:hypothetical protein